MATMAAKLTAGDAAVVVTRGREAREITDPRLAGSVQRAYGLQQSLRELEAELRQEKAYIGRRAWDLAGGGSTVSLQAGGVRCTVTLRHEAAVPEENIAALRKLLGRRFRELVRVRTSYAGTRRLVEEAGAEVLSLLRLRRLSPQFRWESTDISNGGRGASG